MATRIRQRDVPLCFIVHDSRVMELSILIFLIDLNVNFENEIVTSISSGSVKSQLERILASLEFAAGKRFSQFLCYRDIKLDGLPSLL